MQVLYLNKMKEELEGNVISFVNAFFDKHFRQPMLYEIERTFGITEKMLNQCLMDLRDDGRLYYDSRTGTIITPYMRENGVHDVIHLKIVGNIPCGTPLEERESVPNYLTLPKFLVGDGKFFVLTAVGNSMTGAGINDGDFVIVRKTHDAVSGNIVVALNEEGESTLKTLRYDEELNRYYLHPENPCHNDIYPEVLCIQGVAVKVLRNLK